jgi:hypothetical protein
MAKAAKSSHSALTHHPAHAASRLRPGPASGPSHPRSVPAKPNRKVVRTALTLPEPGTAPRQDSGQPRRFLTTLFFMAVLAGMLTLGRYVDSPAGAPRAASAATHPAKRSQAEPDKKITPRKSAKPAGNWAGTSGRFAYAKGYGPVLGTTGKIHRFRVAVEKPIRSGADTDFADEVNRTLGDKRSWIAGHRYRLQRVPNSAHAEFTVYLASASTSERMCRAGGLDTRGYTSCRLPGQVILNDARWETSIPGYGAPLATYRAYAVNHEVGHQLGHSHEACPGKGRPAPVMQQQTFGLKGCVANPWPYIDGKRYTGPPAS